MISRTNRRKFSVDLFGKLSISYENEKIYESTCAWPTSLYHVKYFKILLKLGEALSSIYHMINFIIFMASVFIKHFIPS